MTTQNAGRKPRFSPVSSSNDFVAMEERILAWWNERGTLARYLARNERSSRKKSFIDGPITANNPMGVHHAWGRTYKDLFLRFFTMQGYRQRYQNGFDGQGLWVEVNVEKDLGFTSKRDIEAYGIDRFVELCKERVRKYADIMTQQSMRLGYWMDWDDSYHTMSDENNYMIWHFLKVCHERGWLYEGTDVMPWCIRCGTGLSNMEIATEGYKEIVHPGLFVKFPLLGPGHQGESLLVWTTTPWTLAGNVAAAVHPEHTYVKVRQGDDVLYLGKARMQVLTGKAEVLEELPGARLGGLRYRGPFDELPAQQEVEHRVVLWQDVGEAEGTGIVHVAPGAGAEDFALGKAEGLAVIAPLDEFGNYIPGFGFLDGTNVMESLDPIVKSLREKGAYYKLERYSHRYPVCWRCDTELVFRLVDEWFISMDELRPLMIEITKQIRWAPEFGLDRELDWLRNMRDWMISKKRYYGLALPIYKCASCGHVEVIGGKAELQGRAAEGWEDFEGQSPHRPWVDAVKIRCAKCGEKVTRIPDVGNPWLDAGIVPFSTIKYRTDRRYWEEWFPADWISESFPGQFRNWFYSLLAMSTALVNRPPFLACFSYALVRDEHGEEMHKSKGNAIWFEDAAAKMGVDTMRWLYTRQDPASNLNFGYAPGDEVRRQFLIPLWNVYSFFVTYANLDGWQPGVEPAPSTLSELDRWLLSELNLLTGRVTESLETWRPENAARSLEEFVDGLSNWYVRRSRRRFWKSEDDADKNAAYWTLHTCLTGLIRLLAPFTPFVAEELYQNLVKRNDPAAPDSVHLCEWPVAEQRWIDRELSEAIAMARKLASLARSARASARIKVRQPLAELVVDVRDDADRARLPRIADQLKDELNVKAVRDAREVGGLMRYAIKPNLRLLGPKYGKALGRIRTGLEAIDPARVAAAVEAGRSVTIAGEFELLPEEILVDRIATEGYSAASGDGYVAGVSLALTPELRSEGMAREVVHLIQNLRKDAGLEIADRIKAYVEAPAEVVDALRANAAYVREEVLADDLSFGHAPSSATRAEQDIDGQPVAIGIVKSSRI
ncbi:MAG: isoleucine--tRNA ligase [Chloroflexi bacterium]|nr:isoleucine--tRNA ligase [Chloroflexota bacterium]